MKTVSTVFKAAVLGAALVAAPMFAQSVHVRATVPFGFRIGQQAMPAGEYTLKASANSALVMVQSDSGTFATLTIASRAQLPESDGTPKVYFRVYGTSAYLAAISAPGAAKVTLPRSPAERESAKNVSARELSVIGSNAVAGQ
jgi:hypothetical protein